VGEVEIGLYRLGGGQGENRGVGLGQAKTLVVHKEKSVLLKRGGGERSAVVVLHQMVVAHGAEGGGVHRAVAQKFVDRAMKPAGAGVRDDVDLAAAGAAHVGGVTAGFDLEFFDRVGRGTEVLRVEGRIGVGGAVEQEEIGVRPGAAGNHGRTLYGA